MIFGMPLVECYECKGSISTLAKMICPHCGCPASVALGVSKSPDNPKKSGEQSEIAHDLEHEETQVFCVTAFGDTKPYKDVLKKSFGLKWHRWMKQWKGEIVGVDRLKEFISFCKENDLEYNAPSFAEQGPILPTNVNPSPEDAHSEAQRKEELERAIQNKDEPLGKDPKKNIPEDQRRRIDEGIGGTREDWKKNRGSYGKDMGYG